MSDIGSEEFEEDEGINLGVSENNVLLFCNRNLHTKLANINNIASVDQFLFRSDFKIFNSF